jgi:mannose-6-phosphate isomerase-like protein (cupin superfamily)
MRKLMLGVVMMMFAVSGQEPSCRHCSATYIGASEMQAYLARAMDNGLIDQQVRSVDLGKTQLGVGIVYRGKLSEPAKASVAEHDLVSEVYHVLDGSATLVTGPELVDEQRRPANQQNVREFNGPGKNAASIRNGVTYNLKPGDVVIVPAGTGHWFTRIDDHITYLMVRIDPDKAVPLKDEAASRAYLGSPVKKSSEK